MPRSDVSMFQSPKDGLFYCVSLKGDRCHGPFIDAKQARYMRKMIPAHERSNAIVAANPELRPQVGDERDVNPLAR